MLLTDMNKQITIGINIKNEEKLMNLKSVFLNQIFFLFMICLFVLSCLEFIEIRKGLTRFSYDYKENLPFIVISLSIGEF